MIWDRPQHEDNGPAVLIRSGLSELDDKYGINV